VICFFFLCLSPPPPPLDLNQVHVFLQIDDPLRLSVGFLPFFPPSDSPFPLPPQWHRCFPFFVRVCLSIRFFFISNLFCPFALTRISSVGPSLPSHNEKASPALFFSPPARFPYALTRQEWVFSHSLLCRSDKEVIRPTVEQPFSLSNFPSLFPSP